jgi:hypothetical protein
MTMTARFRTFLVALTAAAIAAVGVFDRTAAGQSRSTIANGTNGSSTLNTPWGAPDLQGIWSNAVVVPFERLPRYGTREFKTDEEFRLAQEALTRKVQLAWAQGTDSREYRGRDIRGSEKDVARAYNEHFFGDKADKIGRRTSMIVDPPDGRMPAYTPEAQKRLAGKLEYLAALLQGTGGGRPGAVSPRRSEPSPDYNLDRINRTDGPEDRSGPERCLQFALPVVMEAGPLTADGRAAGSWGGVFRLVQGMDSVQIYYDVNQGWGFNRVIPITGRAHLPKDVRLYWGDAIGRWDGDALVVDITNFSQESVFRGSRENLHVVERYKRVDPKTLQVMTTVEDPTTWVKPFTFVQELSKNADQPNLVFESGCHEGNYGLLGMLVNTRAAEKLFAEGKGPDPATQDNATGGETDFRDIKDEY